MRLYLLLLFLASARACWFQSRNNAVEHLLAYVASEGVDVDVGFTREDISKALLDLPTAASWIAVKVGGAGEIMKRCDLNGDGVVRVEEIVKESDCLNSCWKQMAIKTFL